MPVSCFERWLPISKTPTDLQTDYIQTYGTYITYKAKKWDFDLGVWTIREKSGTGFKCDERWRKFGLCLLPNLKDSGI
jgi:hypothetical protein